MSSERKVETVTEETLPRALATLQIAFAGDPVIRWFLPTQEAYTAHFAELCHVLAGPCFRTGSAYEFSDGAAAALWFSPGLEKDSEKIAELFQRVVPLDILLKMEAFGDEIRKHIPEEPHWYLSFIGVDPLFQGSGAGALLLRDRLNKLDDSGEIAYLESSNPRNVSFYLRHGFEVLGEVRKGNPQVLTPMIRHPR